MLLLKNPKPRIHNINLSIGKDASGNDRVEVITLQPGINEAPPLWEQARKHPLVVKALEDGEILEIETARKGEAKPGDPADLSHAPEKQALGVIADTVQVVLLHKWLASEKRDKVIKAIRDQLDKLDPAKDKGKRAS